MHWKGRNLLVKQWDEVMPTHNDDDIAHYGVRIVNKTDRFTCTSPSGYLLHHIKSYDQVCSEVISIYYIRIYHVIEAHFRQRDWHLTLLWFDRQNKCYSKSGKFAQQRFGFHVDNIIGKQHIVDVLWYESQ